jgi:hypothetical protein
VAPLGDRDGVSPRVDAASAQHLLHIYYPDAGLSCKTSGYSIFWMPITGYRCPINSMGRPCPNKARV